MEVKKKCTSCGELLDRNTGFYKENTKADGLASQCKACKQKRSSVRARQLRDARRYEKDKNKPLARLAARNYYGSAGKYNCAVLNCGESAAELHHVDYSLHLDVIALCEKHHRAEHH